MSSHSAFPIRSSRWRRGLAPLEAQEPSSQLTDRDTATGGPSLSPFEDRRALPTSNPKGWTWADDQTLFLLEKLLQARREGNLDLNKASQHCLLFLSFVPDFQDRWPNDYWDSSVLRRKLQDLKLFWRAFQQALGWSGDKYNEETGKLSISEENEAKLRHLHPMQRGRVIRKGLTIGSSVTFDSWSEIFADDPPAGGHIRGPRDDAYWQGRAKQRETEIGREEGSQGTALAVEEDRDAVLESGDWSDDEDGVFSQDIESLLPGDVRRGSQGVIPSIEIVRPSRKALNESQRPSQSSLTSPSVPRVRNQLIQLN